MPKHRVLKVILGACFGLLICANSLYRIITDSEHEPWWLLILSILLVLFMMFMYAYMYAGNSYEIKEDRLVLRDVKFAEIVQDILRVNPDIEIRRELA